MEKIKRYEFDKKTVVELQKQRKKLKVKYTKIAKRTGYSVPYVRRMFYGQTQMPNEVYDLIKQLGFKVKGRCYVIKTKYVFSDEELDMIKDQMIDLGLTYEKIGKFCKCSKQLISSVLNGFYLMSEEIFDSLSKNGFTLTFKG